MFEREIQRAKELLTQRMAAASQYVYWDEIRRRADISVFYRNFFGAEAQWWVFDRQMQRAADPRFDYQTEHLSRLAGELDQSLMESARFDHQDLNATIDLAVKTRFNYVLRPRTTLKWFVFRGEPTKPLSEIVLRMDYFLEYDYLLDGVRRWVNEKQQEKIAEKFSEKYNAEKSAESGAKPDSVRPYAPNVGLISVLEFDRVLQGVDNDVILEYSPEEFTDLLTPLFEMFDEIHAADRALQQHRGKVPTPALIIFLDDKGIFRIAQELEELMKTRGLRYVGQREFMHVLNDIVTKLELAIANNELPKPAPIHDIDTATVPLDFAARPEPMLKADDTIGELAIGTAIRTKPLFAETANKGVKDEGIKDEEIKDEGEEASSDAVQNREHLKEVIRESSQEAQNQEPQIIDAEFEITEPSEKSVDTSEQTFDQTAFSAEAANLAAMFSALDTEQSPVTTPSATNTSNNEPSEPLPHQIEHPQPVQTPTAPHNGTSAETGAFKPNTQDSPNTPDSRATFFTRWGSIFGSPKMED